MRSDMRLGVCLGPVFTKAQSLGPVFTKAQPLGPVFTKAQSPTKATFARATFAPLHQLLFPVPF